jgi:hypothetical protein
MKIYDISQEGFSCRAYLARFDQRFFISPGLLD